jgi:hypothetical protein
MVTFAVVWWQGGDVTGQHAPRELGAFLASIPYLCFPGRGDPAPPGAEQLEPVHVATGDVVMAQDDAGDGLFLLLSGHLRVSAVADGPNMSCTT